MRIEVHIERLVLDGLDVSPADAGRVQAAVAEELARVLGASSPGALTAALGAGPGRSTLVAGPSTSPQQLGVDVAGAIGAALLGTQP